MCRRSLAGNLADMGTDCGSKVAARTGLVVAVAPAGMAITADTDMVLLILSYAEMGAGSWTPVSCGCLLCVVMVMMERTSGPGLGPSAAPALARLLLL